MARINSCTKGKRGEREVAAFIRAHGFEARRGKQYSGGADSPDVVHNIPNVHVEAKKTEQFSLYKAMEQAQEEGPYPLVPVVFHRRNRKPWVVVMLADDWLNMMETIRDLEKCLDEAKDGMSLL